MRGLAAALFLLASTPAAAGTPLWQNIEEGMTAAQVKVLYPAAIERRDRLDIREYRPLPNCPSTVRVMLEGGRVHAVQVRGAPAVLGLCASEVEGALRARYGTPVDGSYQPSSLLTNETRSYIWVNAGVVMRLRLLNEARWFMEYVSVARLERERQEQAKIGL